MSKLDEVMSSIDDEPKNKPETSPEAPQNANMDVETGASEEIKAKNGENRPKSQYSDLEKAEYSFKKQLCHSNHLYPP